MYLWTLNPPKTLLPRLDPLAQYLSRLVVDRQHLLLRLLAAEFRLRHDRRAPLLDLLQEGVGGVDVEDAFAVEVDVDGRCVAEELLVELVLRLAVDAHGEPAGSVGAQLVRELYLVRIL